MKIGLKVNSEGFYEISKTQYNSLSWPGLRQDKMEVGLVLVLT